jgi:hypothetical protein
MHLPLEADMLLKGRVRIIKYEHSIAPKLKAILTPFSVWRPLHHVVQDWPIAFCDGSSVQIDDLIETEHLRRGYAGANMNLRYRDEQQWYYLSEQSREEIVLFKNFDSNSTVKARCEDTSKLMTGENTDKVKAARMLRSKTHLLWQVAIAGKVLR